jgi:hypothetical protein
VTLRSRLPWPLACLQKIHQQVFRPQRVCRDWRGCGERFALLSGAWED